MKRARSSSDSSDEAAPPKRQRVDDRPFLLNLLKRKPLSKFQTEEIWYEIKLNPDWNGKRLIDLFDGLHDVFQQALDNLRRTHHPRDLVRIYINHPSLDNPITVPLTAFEDIVVDDIFRKIESTIQSKREILVTDRIDFHVGVQKVPNGAGRKHITHIPTALKGKRSIAEIKNTDNLCLARAIVVCMAKLDNSPDYDAIRRGRNIQTIKARD